jgi:isopentenyldiphosphate isomerase
MKKSELKEIIKGIIREELDNTPINEDEIDIVYKKRLDMLKKLADKEVPQYVSWYNTFKRLDPIQANKFYVSNIKPYYSLPVINEANR